MTTSSRIPAVCAALVSTLTAALPDVDVYDGPYPVEPTSTATYITVGWTPDFDGPTGDQQEADEGNGVRIESVDIPCYVDAYAGDSDVTSRRTAAFNVLASVETALRSDRSLGGAVTAPGWAQIGAYSVRQEQTERGFEIGITFHVVADTTLR